MSRALPTIAAVLIAASISVAGCASSSGGTASTRLESLNVQATVSGGAPQVNGAAALDDAPQTGVTVTVTGASGRRWTAVTDKGGVAHFHVPAGRYTATDECGEPEQVTVTPAGSTSAQVHCDVP
jgi:hypothetical protein